MPIETNFSFHQLTRSDQQRASQRSLAAGVAPAPDLLGALRGFVGDEPADKPKRTWKGPGFNMIWRPNFGGASGPKDFFLQLNMTEETLSFNDITGTGIANRGLLQDDIALGGVSYLQSIIDTFDNSGQHFEPGVWAHVPQTVNPAETETVVRMGSIPHGTTVNMQGSAFTAPAPRFAVSSITPFQIGSPDDGVTNLVHFPEENLSTASVSRTPLNQVAALAQTHLTNPNLFLSDAIAGQTMLGTTVLVISSDTRPQGSVPAVGGGSDNIAFLTGRGTPPTGGPNALASVITAVFWIERVRDQYGEEFDQLQYTQRVLLDFAGLNWPHVTVATLRVQSPGTT